MSPPEPRAPEAGTAKRPHWVTGPVPVLGDDRGDPDDPDDHDDEPTAPLDRPPEGSP
jgi:hypothetical protein